MRPTIRKTINWSFILLLFLPLLVTLLTPVKEVSMAEKRKLVPFPSITLSRDSLRKFKSEFEAYWNDHFGFREQLIALNTRLQTTLLNKSPVTSVINGEEGWLYFNNSNIVNDFLGLQQPSLEQLQQWTDILERRERFLAQHNIRYLFLAVPSKMHIYPEFLPPRYNVFKQENGKTALDMLLAHLAEHSDYTGAVRLKDLFLEEKKKQQLFYKLDTHWNWQGAYLGYGRVMDKLQKWFPSIQPIPASNLRYDYSPIKGDLAIMLGGSNNQTEQEKRLSIKKKCSSKMTKLPSHDPATTRYHPKQSHCTTQDLRAVMIYDSFGRQLTSLFSEQFKEVTYVTTHDFAWLKDFLIREKPDVVIHEQSARNLHKMLTNQWYLPQE